jgi:hypothetical protein
MRKLLIPLFALGLSMGAQAAPPSDEAVDQLLTAMHVQRTLDAMLGNMEQVMRQTMATAIQGKTLTAEQRQTIDAAPARLAQVLRDELSWTSMRPVYAQVYRESFSDEEIAGLTAFYNSPAGMAFTDRMPLVMQKTNAIMLERMGPMMERMKKAAQQAVEDAKTAR